MNLQCLCPLLLLLLIIIFIVVCVVNKTLYDDWTLEPGLAGLHGSLHLLRPQRRKFPANNKQRDHVQGIFTKGEEVKAAEEQHLRN